METGRGQNGEFAIRQPGSGWKVVDQETYEAASQSRLERTVRSFGDAVTDSAGFIAEMAPNLTPGGMIESAMSNAAGKTRPVQEMGRAIQAENDPDQAARWALDAPAAIGGMVGEALLPMPKGAKALRRAVGQSADPVAQGMAEGAGMARSILDEGAAAAKPNPWSVTDATRGITGAPGGADVGDMVAGQRMRGKLENVIFRDAQPNKEANQLADLVGLKLTRGQRRGSQSQQIAEESMTSNPGARSVLEREVIQPNQDRITGLARKAVGLTEGNRFTYDDFAKAADAIDAEFDNIAEGITGKYLVLPDDVKQMKNLVAGATKNPKTQRKVEQSWIEPFSEKGRGEGPLQGVPFNEARMDAQDMWSVIRELNGEIAEASSGAEREALTNLRDFWEDRFFRMASNEGGDVATRVKNVNEKYRVRKLLEKSNVIQGGELNVRRLSNELARGFKDAMMRNDYLDGRGRALEPATRELIQAGQVVRSFPQAIGDSGTATRQLLAGGLGRGVQKALGGKAGAEMYFGNVGKAGGPVAKTVGSGLIGGGVAANLLGE